MTLPRFVVLKSIYNDKYLRYIHEDGPVHGFLQFSEEEVSSPYAKFEVEMAMTRNAKGLVHIRCCFNNKYLVRWTPNHWWIVAGADEPEEDQSKWSCTLFEALYVDGATHPTIENVGQTIRFRHVQLGHYACLWRAAPPHDSCLYAGSPDCDRDWCEIYTFIDWESLSTPTPATFTKEKMALPRVVVLKSNYNDKYLRYIHEDGPVHGFLRFSEEEVSSRYAKYELKRANTSSGKGCVHIRCCYSDKYFARGSANDWWIVAWADEPEEDQSKWSCTLFEPLYVDDGAAQTTIGRGGQTIRFRHVQLGHYACLWRAAPPHDSCLYAGSPNPDKDQCDVYTIIDWESLSILPPKDAAFAGEKLALPRFVVLMSNHNKKFLRYIHEDGEVHGFLQFSGEQVSSPYSKFELEMAKTSGKGLVHVRCCYNNKYFVRRSPNHLWIVAKAAEPEEDQSKWSCTLFEPLHVDDGTAQTTIGFVAQTIRFRHVQLRHYACLWKVGHPHNSCLCTGATEPDNEQCDVYTIIDWEAVTRETITLPSFVVLKSNYNGKYLRYKHEDGQEHGFLQFSGEEIVSPYTKYEVVMAKTSGGRIGFRHLRCCYNNKYLVRNHDYWIVAGADEPEENQSKWSCTLFEPLYENVVAQTIRFRHVQSGFYACLWRAAPPHDSCLYTAFSNLDQDLCDVYTVIDWESLLIVPKHVAFKGNNGNYLSPCSIKGHQYLHFSSSSDITDPMVCNEVITTPNGSVRIKSCHLGKFWGRNNNWILADSDDSTSNNSYTSSSCNFLTRFFHCQSEEGRKQKQKQKQKQENKSPKYDMLFWPIKVDNNVVALRNLGNKKFCKILTADGKINCLSAAASTVSSAVHLQVEEAVISRKIYNVNFRLGDARIYNKSILTLATEDAINRTLEPKTVDVKLSYSESRTWNSSVSLKLLGVKTTIQTTVPLISAEGKIELSGEFSGDYQWGESLTTHEEKVYKVSVPPMTTVRVNLIARKVSCDIPFSYEQLDTTTLTNIQQITETMDDGITETMDDGIYTGSNCFNFKCETEQEKL